jgi:thymidylate synthase ThyX
MSGKPVVFPPSQGFVRALNAFLAADRARDQARAALDAAARAAHVPPEVVRSLICDANLRAAERADGAA